MTSYYKQIDGVKYDRKILELAEKFVADGQISVKEAKDLWASAGDANAVTNHEKDTFRYILKNMKCTAPATAFLKKQLESGKGYYKKVGGVNYDRELLEMAEVYAKDGQVSVAEARKLWQAAEDGGRVTECERRTLKYCMETMKFTRPAVEFMNGQLGEEEAPPAEPAAAANDDLPDFDEDAPAEEEGAVKQEVDGDDVRKGGYAAIHASGFRDFLLKPELLRAIVDCGFEHPSEVQHECIPQAILGTDVLCQAKSGMGKTAVFVLSCLQQLDASEQVVKVLVICHTRELAFAIKNEYDRFSKYFPEVRSDVVFGGIPIQKDKEKMKKPPHIVVGTPGRLQVLLREKDLNLDKLSQFVVDECDKCLEQLDMRRDIQQIFMQTPRKKQVMMFSATMSPEMRMVCKKFMQDPHEIFVDEAKLTLHGLLQYYVKLEEKEKNRKLNDLLDALEFNQVVIFVKSVQRAIALDKLLVECNFPSIAIHSGLQQEDRIARYKQFKEFQKRIMVATDIFGRGIDIERVNIVINYDMPENSDSYLHRVGRAGRFGTKGLALTFIGTEEDAEVLKQVQERFLANVEAMPQTIDTTSYLNA